MNDRNARFPGAGSVPSVRRRLDGEGWTGIVLGAAMVALALVAGLNFTFAATVMPNLAGVDDRTFVEITQRFNANPTFPLSFTIGLVLIALAPLLQRRHSPGVALRWTVGALVLYGVVLAITFAISIPLNEQIDGAGDPDRIADLAHVRNEFEGLWVVSNIVRTLFAIASVAALARALFLHGRVTAARKAQAGGGGSWAPPIRTFPEASSPPADLAREGMTVR